MSELASKENFREIQSFEDACKKVGIDPEIVTTFWLVPEPYKSRLKAFLKLQVIFQAINMGNHFYYWRDSEQKKYAVRFVLDELIIGGYKTESVALGAATILPIYLQTDTSEKIEYLTAQFYKLFEDYITGVLL